MTDGTGRRIARRRQQLRMTQEELAAQIGVAKSSVANWETGKHFPKRHLGAVEQVLGISLAEEPDADPIPPGVREAVRQALPPERAARVEAILEAAMRGEELPANGRPSRPSGQAEAG